MCRFGVAGSNPLRPPTVFISTSYGSRSVSILAKSINPALGSAHTQVLYPNLVSKNRRPQNLVRQLWKLPSWFVISMSSEPRTALTDEELAKRFQATGSPEYFAEIFGRHRRLVFSGCRRFFGRNGLAEDATQETFLRAYQAIDTFREGNLCGWLMRIARNVCIDVWRKQRPESLVEEADSTNQAQPISLEHEMQVSLAMQKVREEMKLLNQEQRRCLEMKMIS